jgi:hypothetical protein
MFFREDCLEDVGASQVFSSVGLWFRIGFGLLTMPPLNVRPRDGQTHSYSNVPNLEEFGLLSRHGSVALTFMKSLRSCRPTILQYWHSLARTSTSSPKGLKTIIILIIWEIWKESNARVFNNKSSMRIVLIERMKDKVKLDFQLVPSTLRLRRLLLDVTYSFGWSGVGLLSFIFFFSASIPSYILTQKSKAFVLFKTKKIRIQLYLAC